MSDPNSDPEAIQKEFVKYLQNINSEMEEFKSEQDKKRQNPPSIFGDAKPHYQIQLFLTSDQIIKIFKMLEAEK